MSSSTKKIPLSEWTKDEIKNLIELFVKYHVPIPEIVPILSKSESSIKQKLIELKLIDDTNHVLKLINKTFTTGKFKQIVVLREILHDLENRIQQLK
jgi:hypothetical protein